MKRASHGVVTATERCCQNQAESRTAAIRDAAYRGIRGDSAIRDAAYAAYAAYRGDSCCLSGRLGYKTLLVTRTEPTSTATLEAK